jgi:hypothetical protein
MTAGMMPLGRSAATFWSAIRGYPAFVRKFTRRVTVPRFTRSINLTIVVPEAVPATPASATPPPKPARWDRVWAVAKVAGPAAASIVAIVISILAFAEQRSADQDQQQAYVASADASQRQAAEQVSFLEENINKPPYFTVLIENLGTRPVYNVALDAEVVEQKTKTKLVPYYFTISVPDIPACSSGTADVATAAVRIMDEVTNTKSIYWQGNSATLINSMSFTDSDGLNWSDSAKDYSETMQLQQLAYPPLLSSPDGYSYVDYHTAAGCT